MKLLIDDVLSTPQFIEDRSRLLVDLSLCFTLHRGIFAQAFWKGG
jgi:hypothetical protein